MMAKAGQVDQARKALRTLVLGTDRHKRATLVRLGRELEACRARGVSYSSIVATLRAAGIEVGERTVRRVLTQWRSHAIHRNGGHD